MQVTPYYFLKAQFDEAFENRSSIENKFVHEYTKEVETLRNKGTACISGFVNSSVILSIAQSVNDFLEKGVNIQPSRNLKGLTVENMSSFFPGYKSKKRLSEDLIKQGPTAYRDITDNIRIRNPLMNIPEILDLALDDRLLGIAADYLGVLPSIVYAKVVKSFANELPSFDTQYFHIDHNASKMFKSFFYLNDVDEDGGPHCYVMESHKEEVKKTMWSKSSVLPGRLSDQDIGEIFGTHSIAKLLANAGDLIIEDTTGWHKGVKPLKRDRTMIVITYGIHSEYSFDYQKNEVEKITKQQLDLICEEKKRVVDLLEIVER